MEFKDITTIEGFRAFIGKGNVFTAEFFKVPKTAEEKAVGRGEYRRMNASLGVSGNKKKGVSYIKGTQPEATAKRKETNEARLQIGCYEMRGTSDRFAEENYRTLTVDPERFIALTANGMRLVNPKFEALVIDGFDLGKDRTLPTKPARAMGLTTKAEKMHAGRTPEETKALALSIVSETLVEDLDTMLKTVAK